MRALDLYENTEIDNWLDQVVKGSWKRNPDGTIDVQGIVKIPEKTEILPVQFGYVKGSFGCSYTKITSLEGAPLEVTDGFGCSDTHITSLEGAPRKVGGGFGCSRTLITSLKGAPQEIGGDFYGYGANITSLKDAPKKVGGNFYCARANITDPYEYRYALLSVISEKFISNIKEIDEIINTYGWDGSNDPKSKRKVPIGLQKLKELSNASN